VGFSSLDLIACGIPKPFFGVMVDARREKIYCNFYRKEKGALKRLFEKPLLVSPEALEEKIRELSQSEPVWLAGDGLTRYGKALEKVKNSHFLAPAFWYPKAAHAMPLIHHQTALAAWCELRQIRPIYMRRSEAEEKWGLCYDERDL
jgi:tRNA A37 threonylcarbamoyladenosine modification protein TsaB